MPDFLLELRFSLRVLARNRVFCITAIAILALGLGATAAIFTVVDEVLLRGLPYPDADRIVLVASKYQGADFAVTRGAQYRFLREHSQSFESLAVHDVVLSGANVANSAKGTAARHQAGEELANHSGGALDSAAVLRGFLDRGGEPERIAIAPVSADFFRVLAVTPKLGRTFTGQEDRPGSACVAMLTYTLWRRRYGSNATLIGKSIAMDGERCSVIGILPASFWFHLDAEIFRPIRIPAVARDLGHYYCVLGRLKPQVTLQHARAELQTLFSRFKVAHEDLVDDGEVGFQAWRYQDKLVGDVRPSLWILSGAVCMVLLIACANVANLLLAQLAGRSRELAVRAALGASRARLIRQLLAEGILLGLAGGGCGLLLARWCMPMLLSLAPSSLPRSAEIAVDLRIAGFVTIFSILTAMAFSVMPALSANIINLNAWLKTATVWTTAGLGTRHFRRLLIGLEAAVSVVLLTGGGLLMHSFAALRDVAPGFDSSNILTFKMSVPGREAGTPAMWQHEHQLLERLKILPGIEAAATATCLPLEIGPDMPTAILGQSRPQIVNPAYRPVSPDYFGALRIPVMRGRTFSTSDLPNSQPVAVINEAMVRTAFGNRSPLGQRVQLGAGLGETYADTPRVIVGVVGDVRETRLDQGALPTVFIPRAQIPDALNIAMSRMLPITWAVRTKVPATQLGVAIRHAVLSVDPQQPVAEMRTMEQALSTTLDRQRFTLLLMTIFAALAAAMAAAGIYAVALFHVRQRRREFGIRLALGATPSCLIRTIMRDELMPVIFGTTVGVLTSFGFVRLIRSLLFETRTNDPFVLGGSALLVGVLACFACWIATKQSSVKDPIQALRNE